MADLYEFIDSGDGHDPLAAAMAEIASVAPAGNPGGSDGADTGGDAVDLLAYPLDDAGIAQAVHDTYLGKFAQNGEMGWMYREDTHWMMGSAAAEKLKDAVEGTIRAMFAAYMAAAADEEAATAKAAMDAATAAGSASTSAMAAAAKAQENAGDGLRKMARQCIPTAARVRNVTYMLTHRFFVDVREFNNAGHLLNCPNGVVDLRTGELRPREISDNFTYVIPVEYTPGAVSDLWDGLLLQWVGDAETVRYLKTAMGYTATGDTREECLFYLYGPGRSGKGSFIEGVTGVLGSPMARGTNFDVFTKAGWADPQNFSLAPLREARMVHASEGNKRSHFPEHLIKQLTGRDMIQAAFKGKDAFQFQPEFKIWLSSNHPVKGDPTDAAFWSRFRVIPFPNSNIGKEDKSIKAQLRSDDVRRAILAWIVEGAAEWYRAGLAEPLCVTAATDAHRKESDVIGQWLDDCTERADGHFEDIDMIFANWKEWAEGQEIDPGSKIALGKRLTTYGYLPEQVKRGGIKFRGRVGLKLV